ncbi:hypothetical protein EVAR_54163_1 [Eumeta japonica]|uniref:Uncharacterized protein n=1 Tax=Eumeta variegata TaxID=151549 RepID=A0A4C1Y2K0_EUMVA|nr:hypothetical protein EVAR_54163_1 [Eumeta japonica]
MARRIDEDTILQLLLSDNSDEENSSESEKEDHIEVDPAYESVSEDEVSSLTQYPPPGLDVQPFAPRADELERLSASCWALTEANFLMILSSRLRADGGSRDRH